MGDSISLRDDEPELPLPLRAALFCRFLFHKKVIGFPVPDAPSFDPESAPFFEEKLNHCSKYLEYGSGGSTFLAAKKGKSFTVVDSDSAYLRSVQKKIAAAGLTAPNQKFLYCDIGFTGRWGKPIFASPNPTRYARWRHYWSAPWQSGDAQTPDLVLADGRFRVACALISIKNLQPTQGWTILVDDYMGRAYYRELEQFADLSQMVGRMAVFTRRDGIDLAKLGDAIQQYGTDWR